MILGVPVKDLHGTFIFRNGYCEVMNTSLSDKQQKTNNYMPAELASYSFPKLHSSSGKKKSILT